MAEPGSIEHSLSAAIASLQQANRRFALVGGLAVSVRSEVRFTRDVDLAVQVKSDADAEALIFDLKGTGYQPVATVEHEQRHRLSTIRLLSPWVRANLQLIRQRGYDRGEDLDGKLAGLLPAPAG